MITLITGNSKKAEQIQSYLGVPLTHRAVDLTEIQSDDVATIACDKAVRAFALVGSPVLVEDTALTFHALGKLPGPYIKWFLDNLGSNGLCQLLSTFSDRRATAVTCVVYHDHLGQYVFMGEATGTITPKPRGGTDFGWNNIFIPEGASKTWAEMDATSLLKDSMRTKALDKFKVFLTETHRIKL
jgi:non-canonical purine NTP pyrophosphatase (RdgB/HAM1 family)